MGKPKDQRKKMRVKKSAKDRAEPNNNETINNIISDLEKEYVKNDAEGRSTKISDIAVGRVQLTSGDIFQTQLMNGKIIQVSTPGNLALMDMVKQRAVGTTTNEELQPLILVLLPSVRKTGETLALISNNSGDITKQRLQRLKDIGIDIPSTEKIDDIFEDEEEIDIDDL